MNTLATELSILLTLYSKLPLEIVNLITRFLFISNPPELSNRPSKMFSFVMKRNTKLYKQYAKRMNCQESQFRILLIKMFCRAVYYKIPVLHFVCRNIVAQSVAQSNVLLRIKLYALLERYKLQRHEVFTSQESKLSIALKFYDFAIG